MTEVGSMDGTMRREVGSMDGTMRREVGSMDGTMRREVGSMDGTMRREVGSMDGTMRREVGSMDGTMRREVGSMDGTMRREVGSSAALPGNMAYFGSAQDDVDLEDEDDEEEECDDRMSALSHNSTSCPSSQRKNKTTPGKKVSNGHELTQSSPRAVGLKGAVALTQSSPRAVGLKGAAALTQSSPRAVGLKGAAALTQSSPRAHPGPSSSPHPELTQSSPRAVGLKGAVALTQSSPRAVGLKGAVALTQSSPRAVVLNGHCRSLRGKELILRPRGREAVSKVNRLSRVSSATVRNSCAKKPPASRTLPSRTVKSTAAALPRGHIPYTKARLLKEAKLTLGKRASSKARQPVKTHRRPHPRTPHSNSGKASSGDAKTPNKQEVQSNKAAGGCCLQRVNRQLHPCRCGGQQVLQGREGVRHSKRRLGLPAEECPTETPESSTEVKKVRLQVNAPETRSSRKVNVQEKAVAVSGGHLGKVTSSRPSSSERRPKRASAGTLMLTRQAQPIPPIANTTTTTTTATTPPANNTTSKKTFQATSKNTSQGTSKSTSTSTSSTSAAKAPAAQLKQQQNLKQQRGSGDSGGSGEKRGAAPPPSLSLTEVPVFRPSLEEFQDPLVYVEAVRVQAESYGLCRVAPPQDWRPECKLKEDMRFVTQVQHIHKLGRRWGSNVLRLACIRKHLQAQGGCELDLARFFQLINDMGGMQQDRLAKLQEAYCQYLLSYDSLDPAERSRLEREVLEEKGRLEKRRGPLEGHPDDSQQSLLQLPRCEPKNGLVNGVVQRNGLPRSLEEGEREVKKQEEMWLRSSRRRLFAQEKKGGAEEEEGGKSVSLTTFYRTARNTMNMCFNKEPGTAEVEQEYWNIVEQRECHVAVHCGKVDTKTHGRVTIPWLNIGMVFSTSCWSRDHHRLPYIDYLHTGADCIWYCIPAEEKMKLDKVVHTLLQANGTPGLEMLEKNIMSGQFVVCFPGAFVSKVCCGYSVSETVHFATPQWLNTGYQAAKELKCRRIERSFSMEKLLYQIAMSESKRENGLIPRTMTSLLKDLRDTELRQRRDLFDAGLRSVARYCSHDNQASSESRRIQRQWLRLDPSDRRCQVCQHLCYLSMVVQESENVVFCLECVLLYDQINHLVSRVCGRVQERRGTRGLQGPGETSPPAKRSPRNRTSITVSLTRLPSSTLPKTALGSK
ncbi:unnamed protein product [Coregonus sp. 'balchen']|nr:unnamed protein product [Coregonus sp. 'balchen']